MHTRPDPRRAFARLRGEHRRALEALETFARSRPSVRRRMPDERPFRVLARYLSGAFTLQLAAEDGVLYPALMRELPELALTLEPLRADHAELRDMTRSLVALLALARDERRDEQLGVLGRDIVDLLRLHLAKEERLVLDWSARALAPPVQRELQRRMSRIMAPARPRPPASKRAARNPPERHGRVRPGT